jgi:BirA family biotin operon repressor/biotin-[acetyl-CoA-carboxylase] ligase
MFLHSRQQDGAMLAYHLPIPGVIPGPAAIHGFGAECDNPGGALNTIPKTVMTTLAHDLVRMMSDGGFHSGTDLGRRLGVTRAAVYKAISRLAETGLEIDRVPGRGYRVRDGLQPLSMERIGPALAGPWADAATRVTLLPEVDSTNYWLLRQPAESLRQGLACVAESQLAGRGRHGRLWIAPPYRHVTLSVGWCFENGATMLSGLSLAAGVAVTEALQRHGCDGLVLKWPNDLYLDGRKLGGLLIDLRGEATGPCWVVLGVGINLYHSMRIADRVDRPWAALAQCTGTVDRNRLVADLISSLWGMFREFEEHGFPAFRGRWEALHGFHGREVTVAGHGGSFSATITGVDDEGVLHLRDREGVEHKVLAGEVSLDVPR